METVQKRSAPAETIRFSVYWRRHEPFGADREVRLFDILRTPEKTLLEFKQGRDLCRMEKRQFLWLLDAAGAKH